MIPTNRYKAVTVFKGSSKGASVPTRVHYIAPGESNITLCGIDLISNNTWQRQHNPSQDRGVPHCQRCQQAHTSRKRKFEKHQASRSKQSKQRHKNF